MKRLPEGVGWFDGNSIVDATAEDGKVASVVVITPTSDMHRDALDALRQVNLDAQVYTESSATVLERVSQAMKEGV